MRFKRYDRVQSRIRRGHDHTYSTGVIILGPGFDSIAGRCCIVRWDDATESYMCTSDLRHDHSEQLIPISTLAWKGNR